jgi:hypothetical protein
LKNAGHHDLADRRKAATEARAALLSAYRSAKEAALPDQEAKQAERLAVAIARQERRTARERLKTEEQDRIQAAAAERQAVIDAAARAEAEARAAAEKNRIAWLVEDQAARKSERDRRYAARKARQA